MTTKSAPNLHDATMAAARRQYQVGQLAWDNWTPDAIAAHLGCSVKRVRADLEAMDMIPDRGPYPQCGTGAGYSIHRRQPLNPHLPTLPPLRHIRRRETDVRPRLLDLFCGAGGAAMGYHRAGFDVVGVDINPQPNYPFEFHQGDALEWADRAMDGVDRWDAIHASPPCQRYSAMSKCRPELSGKYPDLVEPVRAKLKLSWCPYVIENVPGAPLVDPVMLCGTMFGRELYRHRLFESNLTLAVPDHPKHVVPASKAGHWTPGTIMSISGHVSPISHARNIMSIDWCTREELAEAIPPYYTEHIGRQIMASIQQAAS